MSSFSSFFEIAKLVLIDIKTTDRIKICILLTIQIQIGLLEAFMSSIDIFLQTESGLAEANRFRLGYNLDVMRQSACLVLNPIMVYSYGFLFNCTTVGQASDSLTALA